MSEGKEPEECSGCGEVSEPIFDGVRVGGSPEMLDVPPLDGQPFVLCEACTRVMFLCRGTARRWSRNSRHTD